ncbi:peroxidase family protein, partial [Vibrio parahaemolyticus VPTS-2010_2]
PLLRRA